MWRYIGPYLDPHRFEYFPGHPTLIRHMTGRTAELLDALPPPNIDDGVAEMREFMDHNSARCAALIYRRDGAVCGFVKTLDRTMPTPDSAEMLAGIRSAFPQLFTGHKVPFSIVSESALCAEPKSAPNLTEASASSTSTKAEPSKQAKPSSK